jgi:hypothetical protein
MQIYLPIAEVSVNIFILLGLGGIDLGPYWEAFDAIGFRGPWIQECAVGLSGPSLESRSVDVDPLRLELGSSMATLRRHLASRAAAPRSRGRRDRIPQSAPAGWS